MKPQSTKPTPSLPKPAGKIVTVTHRVAPPLPTAKAAKTPQKPAKGAPAPSKPAKPPQRPVAAPAAEGEPMSDPEIISTITDPVRWAVLSTLKGQKAPKEIAEELTMKPANVQYHLKGLVRAGVVVEEAHPEYKNRLLYRRKNLTAQVAIEDDGMTAEVFLQE